MSDLAQRLQEVRTRVDVAARAVGRDPSSVRLVAVSKTKPAAQVEEAYRAGVRELGENYAQELAEKHRALAHLPGIAWHFVGRLQTNKAKVVAPIAAMVHAIDSLRLAEELDKRARSRSEPLPVLVEVNVGGEESKGGVEPDALGPLLDAMEKLPLVSLRGLMSIPPPTQSGEGARRFHRALRELRDRHGGVARLPELSMGMTSDFEVAIEEGATIVRIGTAIFGER